MRKRTFQHLCLSARLHERPERRGARVRTELLVGELDFDRPPGTLELHFLCHRLVGRAVALRLVLFHSTPITSPSVTLLPLHRYDSGELPAKAGIPLPIPGW